MSESQEEGGVRLIASRNVMEAVRCIAEEKGRTEAFYVFEEDDIVRKVQQWRQLLPRVSLYYAIKCNNYEPLLRMLAALDVSFDCASLSEIEKVMALGVPASNIILANPCKHVPHLQRAKDLHVSLMTFDNLTEVHKIKQHYPAACLLLRIRYDDPKAMVSMGSKFGVNPREAKMLLEAAWELGLKVVGVAFHVGSGAAQPSVFYEAIGTARTVFDDAVEVGFEPYLLDVGGGFPGQDDQLMRDMAIQINAALVHFFPDQRIKVIGEPGRYVAMSAFTLATSIIGRSERRDSQGALANIQYFTNESVYLSFHSSPTDPPKLLKDVSENVVECNVFGHSCSPYDRVAQGVLLPPDLDLGAWLVWTNMGAYSLTLASGFNGFSLPQVYQMASQQILQNRYPASSQLLKPQRVNNITHSYMTSRVKSLGCCVQS